MTDVRDLGGPGKAVFDTAQKLQKANLIDEAQFAELTNDKVGPQDLAISNKALDKLQSTTPDAMNIMMRDLPGLNKNILGLQTQALQKTRTELAEARAGADATKEVPKVTDSELGGLKGFFDAIGASIANLTKMFEPATR